MDINRILETLSRESQPYNEIQTFSAKPGIYGFYWIAGEELFPLENADVQDGELLYIGKTESSQRSRDQNTHFRSGKTGSSTVRRTLGALLLDSLQLESIPRNTSDIGKGRITFYKFSPDGEDKLTTWMRTHLAVGFYPYEASKEALNQLETQLIRAATPILNLSKNPGNPCKSQIRALRRACGERAHHLQAEAKQRIPNPSPATKRSRTTNSRASGLYRPLWRRLLPEIQKALSDGQLPARIPLNESDFSAVGDRKSYAFCLKFRDGRNYNDTSGTAVARDLREELLGFEPVRNALRNGHYKLNMGKDFCLKIQRLG